ncbi:DUF881 domain-containing protein [Cellulomonas sp. PhB143]|uniref:DUF881 domain-containing protein n=1 Tax=Cellulomonas sp. PhB143 TaxID=2485186 RepID=UPI000F90D82E|nr:DUF881 domain-containing protein [Cellulomonas sp. PhB143]ROS75568.1 uncharacterized protein YlxW (UPF0749 family) [Cellulomonas sp. PhB143]
MDEQVAHGPARRSRTRRVLGALGVGLVLAACGLMFATSAKLAHGSGERHPENLAELVESESGRVEDLTTRVRTLDAQIAHLRPAGSTAPSKAEAQAESNTQVAAATVAVRGPGLTVALDDAPPGNYGEDFRPDDLVVHQQDLQSVINALWAGGAEAMTLQGQRVDSTTAFRCVGNVLILQGRVYSPPFEVAAIGDQDALRAALDRSPEIAVYKTYVDVVHLGYDVNEESRIAMPRAESSDLEHAVPATATRTGGGR